MVAVPAWGERCVPLFKRILDYHADALSSFPGSVRYVCHTDQPDEIRETFRDKIGRKIDFYPVPKRRNPYDAYGECNREAIKLAEQGDVVMFFNADTVVSREVFHVVNKKLGEGFKCVMSQGIRTLPKDFPNRDITSEDLGRWTYENRHPSMDEYIYGSGKTTWHSIVIFKKGDNVGMRVFHMHPIAVVKDRELVFQSTVDRDLAACYKPEEVFVAMHEFSMAEISPGDKKVFNTTQQPFTVHSVANWAKKRTDDFNKRMFQQRIVMCGTEDCGDEEFMREYAQLCV